MKALSATEAKKFAERWLPAWTGNNPELLASFYADDAFYLDPAIPHGVLPQALVTQPELGLETDRGHSDGGWLLE